MPTHPGVARGPYKPRAVKSEVITLPRAGCQLPAPELPAVGEWSDWARARWAEVWSSPQATQLDDTHATTIAIMVRYEESLLLGKGRAWQAEEMRHIAESMGLTPRSMAALGWVLEAAA